MDMYDVEEMILAMGDIVRENRYLRRELAEARKWEQKYKDLLDQTEARANEGMKNMFDAIMLGVFATPEEIKKRGE